MSDVTDLQNAKGSYSSLQSNYGEFRGPAVKFKIDGSEVTSYPVLHLSLFNSIERADSFNLELSGIYDYTKKAYNGKDKFKLGKAIDIDLGYVDKFSTVFHGYITSLKYEANGEDDIKLIISGMDKTFKMTKGIKSRSFVKKKHSDIVSTLAGEAGLTPVVDSTTTTYEVIEQIGVTDYNFVQIMAEKNNYEAFVSGNKLYFRKLHKSTSPAVTLAWTEGLLGFSREDDLADQPGEVTVRGWDPQKKEAVVGTCSSTTNVGTGSSGKSLLDQLVGGVKEYYYSEVKSQADAKTQAEAIFSRRAMKLVSARITSVGIPELRAGTYVKIQGLDTDMNDTYYIISARHEIDESGYTTTLTVGSNVV